MRPPMQVWTSYFWKSPFDEAHVRDLRRALREWRGENRVYLDKNAKKVIRWTREDQGRPVQECVMPSETVNCFVISHVDGQGRVYPYVPLPNGWHSSVSGSYIRWLEESAKLYLVKSECTHMPMPVIKDGKVSIIEANITLRPGPVAPIVDLNNDGVMTVNYERPSNAEMLAPNQEIEAVHGKAHYERQQLEGHELLLAVPDKGSGLRGISTQMGWEKPFSYLFGEGGGIDLIMHQGLFRRCIGDLQNGNNAKAMIEAETWLGVLTSTGKTSLWHSWFAPMAQANQQEALFAVETQYNISADCIEDLHQSEKFWEIMKTDVDIVVAHDWLGYMWWDFYQDVQEKVTIKCCEACGLVIRGGHSDRRFCTQRENPDCYQKRNTVSQRKKRTHRS